MERSMETVMDKSRLAAFVDGELPPEEAAAVVLHLADHPGDQAYVDELYAANAALAQAFGSPMDEPIPEAIRAAIMGETGAEARQEAGGNVVAFRPRALAFGWAAGGAAMAAGLAGVMFMLAGPAANPGLAPGLIAANTGLAGLLETQAAGVPVTLDDGREAMVLASFALPEAGYCREIEVIDTGAARIDYAVACREEAGWDVRVAMSEGTAEDAEAKGFVTASGAEAQALMSLLDAGEAAVPLDAAAETAALARGWAAP